MLQSSDKIAAAEPDSKPEKTLVAGTRVDGAHLVRDDQPSDGAIDDNGHNADDAAVPTDVATAGSSLEAVQLQAQAEQLGEHLRQRQEELDRRTARLNAQLAELDQEVRNARLWLSEQREALAEREASVTAREQELADKLSQSAAADQAGLAVRRELDEREAQPAFQAEEHVQPTGQEQAYQARQEELSLREQRLQQAETLLLADQAEVVEIRRQLDQRREQLETQARLDRQRLAETQRTHEAQLTQKRQAIEQQAQRVDHRQTAVERSRLELTRLQREAIETRLATEELQAQLAGALAPDAWERSLAALRQRLTECYRREAAAVAEQRAELENLKAELAAERDRLELRHRELQASAGARHAELQQQAGRLETREQELVRQQNAWQEQEQLCREERFIQQQQLRQLLADRRGEVQ